VKLEILEKLNCFEIDKINIILCRFNNHWMIILGIIEIHPKGCTGRIIIKGMRVFINFIFSKLKNISAGEIRCSCVKCKNKIFYYKDVGMMHLHKKYNC